MAIDQSLYTKFGHLELLAQQTVEGFITGLHKSPFHGFSVEFAEHRLYNQGESTKNIDWKLYARTEKLFTKRYEEETNLRCQLIIDNSSSMHFPIIDNEIIENKISFSIKSAAILIYLLKKQRDAVGISLFSEDIDNHTLSRLNDIHIKRLYEILEETLTDKNQNKKTDVSTNLHKIAERIHKRSLVIIFTDMLDKNNDDIDNIFSSLQHFKHNKHEIILFDVFDGNKELNFEYQNRPYKFIDLETNEEIKFSDTLFKEKYKNTILKFRKDIEEKCSNYNIEYVSADSSKDFNQILIPFLVKRSKLY